MSLFQQLFNATILGIVLGLLAVRSRSLLPGIVFHFLNNAMGVARGFWLERAGDSGLIGWIYRNPGDGLYHWIWVALGVVLSGGLLYSLWKRKPESTGETEDIARPVGSPACEPAALPGQG
jgi:sodium transport system permease protein